MIDIIPCINNDVIFAEAGNSFLMECEQDAVDLAAECMEQGTALILFTEVNLTEGFFDLKTGLAGAVLQKFSNYRIKAAAVIGAEKIRGRFGEMVAESNRGNQFRVFDNREDATAWLTKI